MGYCLIHGIGNARSLGNRVRQYVPAPYFYIKAERGDREARKIKNYMKSKEPKLLMTGIILTVAFIIWTILIQVVDVQSVGQNGTDVGFATFNM